MIIIQGERATESFECITDATPLFDNALDAMYKKYGF